MRDVTETSVEVWGGARYVRAYCPNTTRNGKASKRGEVTGFSDKSASRMKAELYKMNRHAKPLFVTLTFRDRSIGPATAKRFLFTLWKRLRRVFPKAGAIWKIEPHKDSTPHFHLAVYGIPYMDYRWLARVWARVVGWSKEQEQAGSRVERARSVERYLAKYVSKSFISPWENPGRFWGKLDAEKLPWGRVAVWVFPTVGQDAIRAYWAIRFEIGRILGLETEWPPGSIRHDRAGQMFAHIKHTYNLQPSNYQYATKKR